MKFKVIFILFNIIVIFAFLFVFLMPLFIIGIVAAGQFWQQNWYLVLIFIGILGLLDTWFLINWKLFTLLESENWIDLADWLKIQIFSRKKLHDQYIRLYCNSLIILGRHKEIIALEELIRSHKPTIVARHALLLGMPYVLSQAGQDIIDFYLPIQELRIISRIERDWVQFFLSFGYLSVSRHEEAKTLLVQIADSGIDPLAKMLAIHIGLPMDQQDGIFARSQDALLKTYTYSKMKHAIETGREQLHVMLLSKFLYEALSDVYKAGTNTQNQNYTVSSAPTPIIK